MQYTVANNFNLPYASNDAVSAGDPVTYTTLNVTSASKNSSPNGAYRSTLLGTVSGNSSGGSGNNVSTAFAYDVINGFHLVGDYTLSSVGGHTNTSVTDANSSGQVIGVSAKNSMFNSNNGGPLGQEAWLYSPSTNSNVSIGLVATTGNNLGYTVALDASGHTGLKSSATANFINSAGQAVGINNRYEGDSAASPATLIGQSAWYYTPGATATTGTTTEIGLIGAGYSYNVTTGSTSSRYSNNSVTGLSAGGQAMGTASAYYDTGTGTTSAGTSLGNDGWIYNPTSGITTTVGLFGNLTPITSGVTNSGTTAVTYQYSKPVATGTSTSNFRSTSLNGINASGQVVGNSSLYNGTASTGQDAFVYTPSTSSYRQLGFYTNSFTSSTPNGSAVGQTSYVSSTGQRSSTANYINTAGQVAGTSTQYSSYMASATSNNYTGTSAWFDDGTGKTTQIGLFSQSKDTTGTGATNYVNVITGIAASSVTNLTDSGLVGGNSTRYSTTANSTLGTDAWVYDSKMNTTFAINDGAADNAYGTISINYLSEDGYAVGQYEAGAAGSTSGTGLTFMSYIWSEAGGFESLGANISPSLSADGYAQLITAYYDGSGGSTIYSSASQSGTPSPGNATALVTLTAVPEPASLSAAAFAAVGLLSRRRRASSPRRIAAKPAAGLRARRSERLFESVIPTA